MSKDILLKNTDTNSVLFKQFKNTNLNYLLKLSQKKLFPKKIKKNYFYLSEILKNL